MHIIHVTHRAWPVIGGAERYVQEVAERQVQDGHRVTVVATDAEELSALWDRRGRRVAPDTPAERCGVRICRLAAHHLPLGHLAYPALRRLARLLSRTSARAALPLARFSPWLPGLAGALAREAGDLLFGWNLTLEGLTAAVADDALGRGVPWVSVPLLHLARPRFYTMSHQLALLRRAQAVLAQTPTERSYLLDRGLGSGQVHIVSPGVHLDEAGAADGARFRSEHKLEGSIVLALGPPSVEKGIGHLLEAMRLLWGEGRDATLVVAGPRSCDLSGVIASALDHQPRSLRWLGPLTEQAKWDAIDAAQIVALPSRTESFGIVYLEAWARSKPVIGARAGAVPDVIDEGVDGLLVPYGDVLQLAQAIRALLDDRDLAARLGHRGYQKVVRRYRWHQQYARLRTVVSEVVRGTDGTVQGVGPATV